MTLRWRYELDAAVAMLVVIPVHERVHPLPGNPDVSKWLCWVNRAVFQGPEERFRERIIIADRGTAKGRHDTQPLECQQHGGAFHGAAIV